jgi:hypothetical protein
MMWVSNAYLIYETKIKGTGTRPQLTKTSGNMSNKAPEMECTWRVDRPIRETEKLEWIKGPHALQLSDDPETQKGHVTNPIDGYIPAGQIRKSRVASTKLAILLHPLHQNGRGRSRYDAPFIADHVYALGMKLFRNILSNNGIKRNTWLGQ